MVIHDILRESRKHYQKQYDQVVAKLLHIPKGSLRRVRRCGKQYWYLRRFSSNSGYKDVYIGPAGDRAVEMLVAHVQERKKGIEELKTVKQAAASVGLKKMEFQEKGYSEIFISLVEAFGKVGLREEGLMLIGSWCFNVYTQVFDVEFYPLRTMDFDLGLRIPYDGDKANIDGLLKDLGFTARIDPAYDKVYYVLPGVGMVEVFIDREKATGSEEKSIRRKLSLRPALVSNLHILTDNPVRAKLRGVHQTIVLPSMPAFFIHRLVTAAFGEYRDPVLQAEKIRKDYKQAALVAKKILLDQKLKAELARIVKDLSPELQEKYRKGGDAARKFIKGPDLHEEDVQWIAAVVCHLKS